MASTNKTEHIRLNQWVAEDPVLREDFNYDNSTIDAAFHQREPVFGQYTGGDSVLYSERKTKKNSVTVNLGFRPSLLIIAGNSGSYRSFNYWDQTESCAVVTPGNPFYRNTYTEQGLDDVSKVEVTANGFIAEGAYATQYKDSSRTYGGWRYLAWR